MKHIYKFIAVILTIIMVLPDLCISQQSRDFNTLPFSEDWQSGSFETNNWTVESDNWIIDYQTGNGVPSAKFHRTPIGTNYSYSLTSTAFDASDVSVGHIYLKFDLKLEDVNATSTEFFKIKVKDSTNWITLDSISNSGSFDWNSYTYNIRKYSIGQQFQIAFEAEGDNSLNIMDWFIDNIEVYRECDPPTDLSMELVWNGPNEYGAEVIWNAPESILTSDEILHYGSLENNSAIGFDNGQSFCAAIKWNNLNIYEDDTIYSINYFISETGFDDIVLKVWTGQDANNEIFSDTV